MSDLARHSVAPNQPTRVRLSSQVVGHITDARDHAVTAAVTHARDLGFVTAVVVAERGRPARVVSTMGPTSQPLGEAMEAARAAVARLVDARQIKAERVAAERRPGGGA